MLFYIRQLCSHALFLYFLLNLLPIRAQTLTYPDAPNGQRYQIDLKRAVLEWESVPGTWQVVGPVRLVNVEAQDFPPEARVVVLRPSNRHLRYLLVDCTNQVYRFDTKTRVLERIDRTYFRGHNCLAHRFVRRDTLYSFGGYGFWHAHNILTYFKPDAAEWESIVTANAGPTAIYRGIGGYLPDRDVFVSALAHGQTDSDQHGRYQYDLTLRAYHFPTRRWKTWGELSDEARQLLNFDLANKASVVQVGTRAQFLVSHCSNGPVDRLYFVDLTANALYEWRDNDKQVGCLNFHPEGNPYHATVWQDTLVYYAVKANTPLTRRTLPVAQVRREARYVGRFYKPVAQPLRVGYLVEFGGLALLLSVLGGWFWYRNGQRPKLVPAVMEPVPNPSNPDLSRLDSLERRMLQALLDTHERGGITSEQLTDVLGIGTRSPENQRRIRSEVINGLNTKLHTLLNVENAVQRRQAEDDRRIAVYQLHTEVQACLRAAQAVS